MLICQLWESIIDLFSEGNNGKNGSWILRWLSKLQGDFYLLVTHKKRSEAIKYTFQILFSNSIYLQEICFGRLFDEQWQNQVMSCLFICVPNWNINPLTRQPSYTPATLALNITSKCTLWIHSYFGVSVYAKWHLTVVEIDERYNIKLR